MEFDQNNYITAGRRSKQINILKIMMEEIKMINKIHNMDCLEGMKLLEDNSVDSIVCDPPYEIGFMGKSWDNTGIAFNIELWKECLRVLKPGGHLLAFSGTRTYHRMACAIEDSGFEIRDMIEWIYASGFPKSMDLGKQFDKKAGAEREVIGTRTITNIKNGNLMQVREGKEPQRYVHNITAPASDLAKQWQGWGTNLKPSHEPIVMARKPIKEKTIASNVEKYGTGGINIDECRINFTNEKDKINVMNGNNEPSSFDSSVYELGMKNTLHKRGEGNEQGRFPANCITLEDNQYYSKFFNISPEELSKKAGKKDRNSNWKGEEIEGEEKVTGQFGCKKRTNGIIRKTVVSKNNHPTVKPVELMAWLIKLVTPENGIVLDPFAGSGSTLVAAKKYNFNYIGFELSEEYVEIIKSRLQ